MLVENRSAQDHKEMLFGFSILKYSTEYINFRVNI